MRALIFLLLLPFVAQADDELKMFEIMKTGNYALPSIAGVERPSVTEVIDKSDIMVRGRVVGVTPYAHVMFDIGGDVEPVHMSFEVALIVEVTGVMKGEDKLARGNRIFVRRVATWPGENRTKRLRDNLYKGQITMLLNEFDPTSVSKDNAPLKHVLYPESEVSPGDTVYSFVDRRAVWINHRGEMVKPLLQDGEE